MLVLRQGDHLAGDVSDEEEEENDGEDEEPPDEEEEFYPDSRQWEAEKEGAEEEQEVTKPSTTAARITEKVTGFISAFVLADRLAVPKKNQLWYFLADGCIPSMQVNKETSVDNLSANHHLAVVRPKERHPDIHQQNPFMRGNTIIRSKTFSPGPQSQYICRVRTLTSLQRENISSVVSL